MDQSATPYVNRCVKGIMKLMHKIPAIKRMLAGLDFQKLINCPCWSKGWVPC